MALFQPVSQPASLLDLFLQRYANLLRFAESLTRDRRNLNGIGDGWMRLMTFDMSSPVPTVRVRTHSTYYKKFSTEMPEYAAWYKANEKPLMTDDEFHREDDFTLELTDFRERFVRQEKR